MYFFIPCSLFTFIHYLRSFMLLIISCVIHGFLDFLSTLSIKSLIVSVTVCLYYSSALLPSHFHILLHQVFLLEYLALSFFQHITSADPIFVCLFLSSMIFFKHVRIYATIELWSKSVSAPGIVGIPSILFLNRCFTSMYSSWCRIRSSGSF